MGFKDLSIYTKTFNIIKSCKSDSHLVSAQKYLALAWNTGELSEYEHRRLRDHYFNQIEFLNENR